MVMIGIDPGVNTGIAIWDSEAQRFDYIGSMGIIAAMVKVSEIADRGPVKVIVEDARLRKWFGDSDREKLQGAGSIKRDCGVWQEFLETYCIAHQFVAPKNNVTKLDSAPFKAITKWPGVTNKHARDAAMIVFGRKH